MQSRDTKILRADNEEIEIPYSKWDAAKSKKSFTAMTWALILAAFDEKVLRVSNYKGGLSRSKKNGADQVEKFKKLDEKIINIIKGKIIIIIILN